MPHDSTPTLTRGPTAPTPQTEMRTFFRHNFTHARYISAAGQTIDALHLADATVNLDNLYLDMRPYMNRSPLTVRKDCSAARAHQVFVNLGLRHLLVVDVHNHVVGMITRKDLDHAAGHGWWRMSHQPTGGDQAHKELSKIAKGLNAVGLGFLLASGSNDGHGGHGGGNDEEQGNTNGADKGHSASRH